MVSGYPTSTSIPLVDGLSTDTPSFGASHSKCRRDKQKIIANVTPSHLLGLLLSLGLRHSLNAGKKMTLNPLLCPGAPWILKVQMQDVQEYKLLGMIKYLLEICWRQEMSKVPRKSLAKLGRLSTFTSESNRDGSRSSTSFPRPKVPTHTNHNEQNYGKFIPFNQVAKAGIE